MTEHERKNDDERLQMAAESLGEFFDSVQIFVTKNYASTTQALASGSGNVYARLGQVKEWVVMRDEEMRQRVRNKADDDGDS